MEATGSDMFSEPQTVDELFSSIILDDPLGDSELPITTEVGIELGEPIQVLAQTSNVRFYSISCSGGATSTFRLPVTAYDWHLRFGYFRADGSRISLSTILHWHRSFYAGSVLTGRCSSLPAGTKDLRAFWWHGNAQDGTIGEIWWNRIRTNC